MILAIESSGATGGVALLADDQLLGTVCFTSKVLYSQRLLPSLDWLLARTGRKLDEIKMVAVSSGPGSFTGLRVGMSMAKGIALALRVPIVGISSLEALALRAAAYSSSALICPLLDARQGFVYTAIYRLGELLTDGFPQLLIERKPAALRLPELLEHIAEPTVFAGDGAISYSRELSAELGSRFILANPLCVTPAPEQVAVLGARRFLAGEADDLFALEPFYLRHGYMERRPPGTNR